MPGTTVPVAEIVAYDSLLVQAARCDGASECWAAQPGRRGEVYGRAYGVRPDAVPEAKGVIEVLAVVSLTGDAETKRRAEERLGMVQRE